MAVLQYVVKASQKHEGPGGITAVDFVLVRPAWALTRRRKSSGNEVAGTQGNRKAAVVRPMLKEAGNEPVRRRTEIGCEAQPTRASGPMTAKRSQPQVRRRRSGGGAGKVRALTWGDLA